MKFDSLVEQKIREAMAAGEFDDLEGKGRPIDLSTYFSAPEEWRASFAVLKNAGVVPEEMELRKEIHRVKQEFESCTDEARRSTLKSELAELILKYDLTIERNRRHK
jgi:hypothetical protein